MVGWIVLGLWLLGFVVAFPFITAYFVRDLGADCAADYAGDAFLGFVWALLWPLLAVWGLGYLAFAELGRRIDDRDRERV